MAAVNIDYITAEYCFDRGFHFQIPGRDDYNYNTVVRPDFLDVYTDGSKLDNRECLLSKTGPEHFSSSAGLLQHVLGGGHVNLPGRSMGSHQRCFFHSRPELF